MSFDACIVYVKPNKNLSSNILINKLYYNVISLFYSNKLNFKHFVKNKHNVNTINVYFFLYKQLYRLHLTKYKY